MSWCSKPVSCRKSRPTAVSRQTRIVMSHGSANSASTCFNDPMAHSSVTMDRRDGCMHAPTKRTMFLWRSCSSRFTSFSNSWYCQSCMYSCCSSTLMATFCRRHRPAKTRPNEPMPIFSSRTSSVKSRKGETSDSRSKATASCIRTAWPVTTADAGSSAMPMNELMRVVHSSLMRTRISTLLPGPSDAVFGVAVARYRPPCDSIDWFAITSPDGAFFGSIESSKSSSNTPMFTRLLHVFVTITVSSTICPTGTSTVCTPKSNLVFDTLSGQLRAGFRGASRTLVDSADSTGSLKICWASVLFKCCSSMPTAIDSARSDSSTSFRCRASLVTR
mmetsp:Transcript_1447/g.4586  ORF Transcript_1447/g.4586 Transcript_1447/m.4586 type:complete len:332 (+) Transcript_1447:1790-2785(+)